MKNISILSLILLFLTAPVYGHGVHDHTHSDIGKEVQIDTTQEIQKDDNTTDNFPEMKVETQERVPTKTFEVKTKQTDEPYEPKTELQVKVESIKQDIQNRIKILLFNLNNMKSDIIKFIILITGTSMIGFGVYRNYKYYSIDRGDDNV